MELPSDEGSTQQIDQEKEEQDQQQEQQGPEAQEEEGASRPVRLYVFWGYAGWSRCQLMGEIARGSWGLCRSYPQDVVESAPSGVWQQIYERLMFAPQSEMS